MITKEQILRADGEELSRLMGEVLQPETGLKHDYLGACQYINCHKISPVLEQITALCPRCKMPATKKLIRMHERFLQIWHYKTPCKTKPIPLTWKEAMKWRDWAVENFSLFDVMESMRIIGQEFNKTHDRFYAWWTLEAQPKHYLKAAAICKLNSESE